MRNMAVRSLGLSALLSCEFARTHLVLFLQVISQCYCLLKKARFHSKERERESVIFNSRESAYDDVKITIGDI